MLKQEIPIITYNGAVILQNDTYEIIAKNTFKEDKNDIEMFEIANESYAVQNAVNELKSLATGIIGSNDSDAVAKWLYGRFKGENFDILHI